MMYPIPYCILGLLLFFLYFNECRKLTIISINNARIMAFVLILVFVGLRGHVGSDFITYYAFFDYLPNVFNLKQYTFTSWYFEPGFIAYSSIVKTIVPNYFGWVFINTLIDLLVLNYIFKRYTYSRILPFIFFIAFNGLAIEFNLYRNIKALDLFLLSLPYLENKKWRPYFVLNILGMTFHTTSILYLPLYFILNKEIPSYIKWIGIVVANIIFLAKIPIINSLINSLGLFQILRAFESLANYTDNSELSYGLSFGYIERTFGIILFTILYKQLCNQNKSNKIFYNCFWLYYISFLSFYEVAVLTQRIPLLFIFSYWILYPNVVLLKYRLRPLLSLISLLLAFIKIYSSNTILPSKYDNIILGIEDYDSRKDAYERYVAKHF